LAGQGRAALVGLVLLDEGAGYGAYFHRLGVC
jgi:hypothetical protein